jgi:hypothetical protein
MDGCTDWSPWTIIRHHPPWGRVRAHRGTRGVGWGKNEARIGKVHTCWVGAAVPDATMASTPHRRGDMACRKSRMIRFVITSECGAGQRARLNVHDVHCRCALCHRRCGGSELSSVIIVFEG